MVEMSGHFRHLVWMLFLKLKSDDLKDNIIDMTTDRRFQTILKEKSLSEFWCEVSEDYSSLGRSTVTALLPFGSTYLCERTFLCYGIIQDQAEKLPASESRLDPRR
jgi:hypothetical protein